MKRPAKLKRAGTLGLLLLLYGSSTVWAEESSPAAPADSNEVTASRAESDGADPRPEAESEEETNSEPADAFADRESPESESALEAEVSLVDEARSAPTTPETGRPCSSSDQLQGLCDRVTGTSRGYRVVGRVQYRMLTVVDDTPLNDNQLQYTLGGEYDLPVDGLYVHAWLGLAQEFVKVADQSTVQMLDTLVGAGYHHAVSLTRTGWDRDVNFYHQLGFYLPTSRINPGQQDLYVGLDWLTAIRLRVVHRLDVGVNLGMGYAFMEHNGPPGPSAGLDAGPGAGQYDRFNLDGALVIQEGIFAHPRWGSLVLRGTAGVRYVLSYPSTQEYLSETSDQSIWRQEYFWGLRLSYTPIRYVTLDIGLEHGTPIDGIDVLRQGIAQTADGLRDELELVFSLWGRY